VKQGGTRGWLEERRREAEGCARTARKEAAQSRGGHVRRLEEQRCEAEEVARRLEERRRDATESPRWATAQR
jgi:hypothetical protein